VKKSSTVAREAYAEYVKNKEQRLMKKIFSPNERSEMLLKYVERESKLPAQRFQTEEGVKLGIFWNQLLCGQHPNILASLKQKSNMIQEAHMNHESTRPTSKTFRPEEKAEILLEYIRRENKVPPEGCVTNEGVFLHKFLYKLFSELLEKSNALRESHERYLNKKKHKKVFSPKQKSEMLVQYVNENGKLPTQDFVNSEGVKLYDFLHNCYAGKNSGLFLEIKEKSKIIKDGHQLHLTKKDKKTLSPKEKALILLNYCETSKQCPKHNFVAVEEGIKVNLGFFWNNLLQGHNSDIFEELKQKSSVISEAHQDFLSRTKRT